MESHGRFITPEVARELSNNWRVMPQDEREAYIELGVRAREKHEVCGPLPKKRRRETVHEESGDVDLKQ